MTHPNISRRESLAMLGKGLTGILLAGAAPTILIPSAYSKESKPKKLSAEEVYKLVEKYSEKYGLPSVLDNDWMVAMAHAESTFYPDSVSDQGARGLYQLMKAAWTDAWKEEKNPPKYTNKNLFNPDLNTEAGIRYTLWTYNFLNKNQEGFKKSPEEEKRTAILMAYNLGAPGLVFDYQGDINNPKLPKETKNHPGRVEDSYKKIIDGEIA